MTSPSTREIKVKDITDEIDNWVIKVRVLRSWPIFDSIELDDMITLEVVLIDSEVVVLHMVRMMPFEPALFGLSVVQVVPNATKLVFNPPIVEVFNLYDRFLKHAEEMLTEMEYVRRDPCDVKLVDDFILSYPRRTIRELCVNANVGCYVILATITAIDGNDDWRHLYTNAKPKANERSKFPVSHLHDCLIPRYNVKANVFDGVESRGFYLDDHHVIDYLTKSSSQSIGVDDPFECMVGTQFLFIVKKTCDHKVDQDGCFKTLSFCGDPEILRIFSERDCYLLDSWAKIAMLTSLKKTCPIEDSFLKSNRAKSTWGVRSDRVLNPTCIASTSSSMGLVESSLPMLADCMRVLH